MPDDRYAVATIVPHTAEDHYNRIGRKLLASDHFQKVARASGCVFHEDELGDTQVDGALIGATHLFGVQYWLHPDNLRKSEQDID